MSNQQVRKLAQGFIPLRLDEVGDAKLFTHYSVDGVGIFLIADLEGEIVDEVPMRDLNPEPMTQAFITTLTDFLAGWPALRDAGSESGK